ncbi:hypothetical protein FOL47_007969 [Perkinsus chesapeaki]|uniref:Uncharacterized protein n=1 Tax=Perkinsus chesapeaki TaxID=330153 RepID=A0A7J6LH44_PERCH|nr:hypothetical protein FOL47_007969 [Perkinsus chesapeaki]
MTFAPPRRAPSLMFPADVRREIGGHLLSAAEAMKREMILMRLHDAIQGRRDVFSDAPEPASADAIESPSRRPVQGDPDHFRLALRSLLGVLSRQTSVAALGEKAISEIIASCQGARGFDRHVDGHLKELTSHLLRERERSPTEEKLTPISPKIRPGVKSRKELPSSPKLRLGRELCDELWGLPRPAGTGKVPVAERIRVEGPLVVHRGRGTGSNRSLKMRNRAAARAASVSSKSVETHGDGGGGQCPAWMAHPVKYREARVEEVRRLWAKQEREAAHVQEKLRRERYGDLLSRGQEHTGAVSEAPCNISVVATRRSQSARSLRESGRSLSPVLSKQTLEPSRSAGSPEFTAAMASVMASQRSLVTTSSGMSEGLAEVLASVRPISRRGPFARSAPREVTVVRKALSSVYDHCASRLFVESMTRSYRPKCSGKSVCSKSRQKETNKGTGLPLGAELTSEERDDGEERVEDCVAEIQRGGPEPGVASASEQPPNESNASGSSFDAVGSSLMNEKSAIESRQSSLTVESMRRKSKRIITRATNSIDERSQRSAWYGVVDEAVAEMPSQQQDDDDEDGKYTLTQSVSEVIRRSSLRADPTLAMSASQLYERYISRDDNGEKPNLTDRQVAGEYVEALIRRVTRPSASSARQRRILGGSGYYARTRW